jgi:fibronectin type 3 domain-containing protein
LLNGSTYYYKLSALNAIGESPLSNERSAIPATVPGAPTLNSPTAGNATVTLSWSAPSSTGGSALTGYKVYRGSTSGGETLLTTLGTATSYTDNGLSNGSTYYYKVSALNAIGESPLSNERSATPATIPGAPNLSSANAGNNTVTLTWSAPTSNGGSPVTGYRVYRSTTSGAETLLTTLGNLTSFSDIGVTNGTTYYYKVSTVNGLGEGLPSGERSAMPVTTAQAPTLMTAVPGNSVTLTWSAPAADGGSPITGYRVYRSTTSGGETFVAAVGLVTTYTDETTSYGTTYYYQVSAFSSIGEGGRSNELSATPVAPADTTPPTVPGSLRALVSGTSQIALDWSNSTDNVAVTGYEVYRDGTLVATAQVSHYLDSGLITGSSHVYQVRAQDAAGNESLPSSSLSAKTASFSKNSSTGGLSGVVYNQAGMTLAGAVVTLTLSNGSTKSTKTSTSGVWKLSNLLAKTYTVTASLTGYSPSSVNMTVAVDQTMLATFSLSP